MRAMTGVVGRLVKQTGGQGQFAHVVLDVSPREDDQVVFNDRIVGGVVPRSFIAAVEKGVRAALSEGPQGHPVVGIEVSLVDGQTHAKDSSEMAFHRAGAEAIKAALAEGGTQLLEPVMAVTVHSPSASVGDVVGDLNRRHGRIARIDDQDGRADVDVGNDAKVATTGKGLGVHKEVPARPTSGATHPGWRQGARLAFGLGDLVHGTFSFAVLGSVGWVASTG